MDNQTPERALERYKFIVDYFEVYPERLNEANKNYLNSMTTSLYFLKTKASPELKKEASGLLDKIDSWLGRKLIFVFPKEGAKK
jgi:hypothetical protein